MNEGLDMDAVYRVSELPGVGKQDRQKAMGLYQCGEETSSDGNVRGILLAMLSIERGTFLVRQTGQPTEKNHDNKDLRRAIRWWSDYQAEAHCALAKEFQTTGHRVNGFLRSRGAGPGAYVSTTPELPGMCYIGKTRNSTTDRGSQGRKDVHTSAQAADLSPEALERQTHQVFEECRVKVKTETWWRVDPEEVRAYWDRQENVWTVYQ